MKNIIIIEDHSIVLFNLKIVIESEPGFKIIETYSTGKSLMQSEILDSVDIALLDINLPDVDGFELCSFLTKNYPNIKIIGTSSFDDNRFIDKFMSLGAHGYVVKGSDNKQLIKALHTVSNGDVFLCEVAKSSFIKNRNVTNQAVKFTKKEKLLLRYILKESTIDELYSDTKNNEEDIKFELEMLEAKMAHYNINKNSVLNYI